MGTVRRLQSRRRPLAAGFTVVEVEVTTQAQATGLGSYNLANQQAVFEDRVRLRNL